MDPAGRSGPAKYNLNAISLQGKPKESKGKSLHFLGFPWPNWDLSKGYGESK
jgi:hypothetical protein